MNMINWCCPMCNNKNNIVVEISDINRISVLDKKCDNCLEISEITVELKSVVTHVDLK